MLRRLVLVHACPCLCHCNCNSPSLPHWHHQLPHFSSLFSFHSLVGGWLPFHHFNRLPELDFVQRQPRVRRRGQSLIWNRHVTNPLEPSTIHHHSIVSPCARAQPSTRHLGICVDVAPTNHIMARLSWLQAFVVASVVSTVCAGLAETYPMSEVLDWEIDSQMQLSLTSDGDLLPILYAVIPLTADLGLNESQTNRGVS